MVTVFQGVHGNKKHLHFDFYGKLEHNAFEDWLMAIEDYFDWFAVSEDKKVRYVWMKDHSFCPDN